MRSSSQSETLQRIQAALEVARMVLGRFAFGAVEAEYKLGHDPITEADRLVNEVLRQNLWNDREGWLSEESVDDFSRLEKSRVWVVDPLDGTREFVAGIPEFCVSIAMVENGRPIAGGICNPATNEIFLGSLDSGITYNGKPARATQKSTLKGALVLASRSEVMRGEWKAFENLGFQIRPMGSVAYKLARVSAGLADVTFTLTPKHEWDVAAGAVLVESAGGFVTTLENAPLRCNNKNPLLSGLVAGGPLLRNNELFALLDRYIQTAGPNPKD
jgi:myo-inositol-1(or 4)-monophosphatase